MGKGFPIADVPTSIDFRIYRIQEYILKSMLLAT